MKSIDSIPHQKNNPVEKKVGIFNKILDEGTSLAQVTLANFKYNAIQQPLDGVTQLIDNISSSHLEKSVQFFKPAKIYKFGTANWAASQIGSGLGIACDFMLADKLIANFKGNLVDTTISKTAIIGQSAISGALYEGIFTPTAHNHNFIESRFQQALSGAVTFGVMSASAVGLKDTLTTQILTTNPLTKVIKSNMLNGTVSGMIGGITGVNFNSLINGQGLAPVQTDIQTSLAYAVAGLPLGMMNSLITHQESANLNNNTVLLQNVTDSQNGYLGELNFQNIADQHHFAPIQENSSQLKATTYHYDVHDSYDNKMTSFHFDIPEVKSLPDLNPYENNELIAKVKNGEFIQDNKLGIKIDFDEHFNPQINYPDGTKLTLIQNGRDVFQLQNGINVYRDTYSDKIHYDYCYPDGWQISKTSDGATLMIPPYTQTRLSIWPDGQKYYSVYNKNDEFYGNYEERQVNGIKITKAELEDGSQLITSANGLSVSYLRDGTIIYKGKNQVTTYYPDGREVTKNANGSITKLNKAQQELPEYNELKQKLITKFNQGHFTHSDYEKTLSHFNGTDKPLAQAILNLSLNNMSIAKLMDSMSLHNKDNWFYYDKYVVKDASSTGNMLAYLYRKALGNNVAITTLKELNPHEYGTVLFFDDLTKLNAAELAKLQELNNVEATNEDYKLNLKIYDTNNFEKGINFFDTANNSVVEKLSDLVSQAKELKATLPSHHNLSNQELATAVLNNSQDNLAKLLNIKILPSKTLDHNALLMPPVSLKSVDQYLNSFKTYNERFTALKFLANESEYFDIPSLLNKAKTLHAAIGYKLDQLRPKSLEELLRSKNKSFDYQQPMPALPYLNDLHYIVGLDDGSSSFINYLYRKANNIPETNFLSRSQLSDHPLNENTSMPNLVMLDDAAYSGTQLDLITSKYFDKSKDNLILALLGGSYKSFATSLNKSNSAPHLVTLASHLPIYPLDVQNTIYRTLTLHPEALNLEQMNQLNYQLAIKKFVDQTGSYKDINSFQIWPYMAPDTSIKPIKDFAKQVLNFR